MLLDISRTKTIVRPDMIDRRPLLASTWLALTKFTIADKEDSVILRINLMSSCGFILDERKNLLEMVNEELVLNSDGSDSGSWLKILNKK